MQTPTEPQQPLEVEGRVGDDGENSTAGLERLVATVRDLRAQVDRARIGADTRGLIELAKGVLVERLHIGPAEAARQVSTLAEQAGLSQAELAADIVNRTARDGFAQLLLDEIADPPPEVGARLRTAESGVLAAGDVQAVTEAILEHALAPLGATAAAVWTVDLDASLTLAGAVGFNPDEIQRWHYVPPAVTTAASSALTSRRTVWIRGGDSGVLPSIGGAQFRDGGRVATLATSGGRIRGVLEICWPMAMPTQPPQVIRQLDALAELCGHAIETRPDSVAHAPGADLAALADAMLDPSMVLVPELDEAGAVTDFRIHHANARFADPEGRPRSSVVGATLLEAYPTAAAPSALFDTISEVHNTGAPFRAERLALSVSIDQPPLTEVEALSVSRIGGGVLITWRPQDESAKSTILLGHAQRLSQVGGFDEDKITGEITWTSELYALYGLPETEGPIPLADLAEHAHPDDSAAIARFLRTLLHHGRPASTVFRMRRPDGAYRHSRVIAEPLLDPSSGLVAVRGAYQDISAQHWTEVALAATRDQLVLTEQESAERNRLALQLQRAIMPSTHDPIELPDLRIAVRYRPAEKDHLVGGDWYDAVVLPSGELLISVGDIAGHGIDAATGMVVLRNALRGLAATGAAPNQLLTWLNNVAGNLADQVLATALCGLYDPSTRILRWARAGHLPPVLVRDGHASTLPMLKGLLLGVKADAEYELAEVRLREDDVLVMYTDGLIERRTASLDDSLDHLLDIVSTSAVDLDQRLDRLLLHCDADTDDDACIVGIQVR